MSDVSDPAVGLVIADRYILLERVGEGKTGALYRAEHALLRSQLAVKLLHKNIGDNETSLQTFQQHVTIAARIESEHLARISDFGRTDDGRVFIVMEYLDGEVLGQLVSREQKLDTERALELIRQLGDVLAEAHALGLVHGDVRPRNIFVLRRKRRELVKLLGLGMTQLAGDSDATPDRRGGDPHFLAPEQARGGEPSSRSDIYSLAAVSYTMLAGSPPFAGTSSFDLLNKQMLADPTPLRERNASVPEEVAAAIDRALCKDPQRRYATVTQFVRDLGMELAEEAQATAPSPGGGAAPTATIGDASDSQSAEHSSSGEQADSNPETSAQHVSAATTIDDRTGPEISPIAEPETAPIAEPETAPTAEPETAPIAEPETAPTAEPETAPIAEPETAPIAEPETAPIAEPETAPAQAADEALQDEAAQQSAPGAASSTRDDSANKTLMGYGVSVEEVRRAIAERGGTAKPSSGLAQHQTLVQGDDVAELSPEVFSSPTIVPESASEPTDGLGAEPAEPSGPTATRGDPAAETVVDLAPDTHQSGESGEWFAEGMAAEEALQRRGTPSSLPAMYDSLDELEGVKRRFTPSVVLAAVVGVAALVLGIVFLLARSDEPAEAERKQLGQRVIPVRPKATDERENEAQARAADAAATPKPVAAKSAPDAGKKVAVPTRADARQATPPSAADASSGAVAVANPPPKPPTVPPAAPKVATESKTSALARTVAKASANAKPRATAKPAAKTSPPKKSRPTASQKPRPSSREREAERAKKAEARRLTKLARAHLRRGSHEEARQLFQQALELAPRSAAAHGGLGEVAFEQGNYRTAARHLRAAVAASPRSSRFHAMLGNVYFKQGRTNAAVTEYRRALEISPNNQAARGGLEVAIRRMAEES